MNNAISRLRKFLGSLLGFVILKSVIQVVLMAIGDAHMTFPGAELFQVVFITIILAIVSVSSIFMTIARYSREKKHLSRKGKSIVFGSLCLDIGLLAGFILYMMPHLLNPDLYDSLSLIRQR